MVQKNHPKAKASLRQQKNCARGDKILTTSGSNHLQWYVSKCCLYYALLFLSPSKIQISKHICYSCINSIKQIVYAFHLLHGWLMLFFKRTLVKQCFLLPICVFYFRYQNLRSSSYNNKNTLAKLNALLNGKFFKTEQS